MMIDVFARFMGVSPLEGAEGPVQSNHCDGKQAGYWLSADKFILKPACVKTNRTLDAA
jgi:hypothetical protein